MTSPPASGPPSIHVSDGRLAYGGRLLFDGLALDLPAGRWTCLLGPSGVGKSTLLRLIAGIAGASGSVRMAAGDGGKLAGRVAYMAQQDLLLPWLGLADNVTLGPRLRGEAIGPERAQRVREIIRRVRLEGREHDRPASLSGGMRQRAALARTLVEDRPVVLMDEPFSAVDAITRLELQALAAELLAGRTVLLVTHDPLEALRLGHRVHVMAGQPATLGPPIMPPGDPLRDPTDPALLPLQRELLRRLTAARAPA
jgi:putative hydroxymethylpyrimidine transport system ATP-binding protein